MCLKNTAHGQLQEPAAARFAASDLAQLRRKIGGTHVAIGVTVLRSLVALAVLLVASPAARAQDSVCAEGPTLYGIDVSRFQGTIDWQQVKSSGVVYAWIQISRHLDDIDAKFEYNWAEARRVGVLRGAYQRFHPNESVSGQANLFLEKLGTPQPGDLPPMLDVEDADGKTAAQIAAAVQEWMDIVEPVVGVKPLIYTGYYFWKDSVGNSSAFADHPLWIANYSADCPLIPSGWNKWTFHQYSSTTSVPGIPENTVDKNRFDGTMDDLLALAAAPECGDGMCTGQEDSGSCEADCPPCGVVPSAGDVVDDTGDCFQAGGNPDFIREENAGYGSFLKWTHATSAAAPANFGVWDLHFEDSGKYLVEAYTAAPYAQSKQAVYQVSFDGQMQAVEIDQTAIDGWTRLGEFEFAAGGGQSIRVDDNTGEPGESNVQLVFDAVRFTRVGPKSDDDGEDADGDGEPDGASGGNMVSACAAGGAGGCGWLALLALVPVIRRRRRR
jgi:lysozyme